MKIKRTEWEALNQRISQLEADLRETKAGTLMQSKTGKILMNIVVPEILAHLKLKSVHGHSGLLLSTDASER